MIIEDIKIKEKRERTRKKLNPSIKWGEEYEYLWTISVNTLLILRITFSTLYHIGDKLRGQ